MAADSSISDLELQWTVNKLLFIVFKLINDVDWIGPSSSEETEVKFAIQEYIYSVWSQTESAVFCVTNTRSSYL